MDFVLLSNTFYDISYNIDFFKKLALAILIGILIGIEREHTQTGKIEFAGVRSFTLSCICGMLSAFIGLKIGIAILYITALFIAGISAILMYIKSAVFKQTGTTTPLALFSTFLLGVMISYEMYLFAIAGAVIVTLLLAEKQPMHAFARSLNDEEIISVVRFLAVIFILLPITPDYTFLGAVNLRNMLYIVILVSLISFSSFIAMKQMGARKGIPVSGFLGGLVNSEATAGALSSLAKRKVELINSCLLGIILSNAMMIIRNLVIVYIAEPSGTVLKYMILPQMILFLLMTGIALKIKDGSIESESLDIPNPFALAPAIKFAFGVAALSLILKIVNDFTGGGAGIYAIAAGGFVSSAAVTASAGTLAYGGIIDYHTAAMTALLATIISTVNKPFLVRLSGPAELYKRIKYITIVFVAIGLIVIVMWKYFIMV